MDSKHVEWARKIRAMAQIGLQYAGDPYDRQRYAELQQLAAEMMAEASDVPQHRWQALFEQETGYATPRVDVRGAVFRDGEVLLSREADDGGWSLPGGWADINEPPSVAVARELSEETGYRVRCTKLAAVLDRDLHFTQERYPEHIYKLLFLCEIIGEAGGLDHDITAARFFPVDDLPPLSLKRILPDQIRMLHRHYLHPELPTAFD